MKIRGRLIRSGKEAVDGNLSLLRCSETVSAMFGAVYLGEQMNVCSAHSRHSPCLNFSKPLCILPRKVLYGEHRQENVLKREEFSFFLCNIYHGTVFIITPLDGILIFDELLSGFMKVLVCLVTCDDPLVHLLSFFLFLYFNSHKLNRQRLCQHKLSKKLPFSK